ncbi:MAG: translation initiation factor IF-3 C-terminal domain-containing protein, partial [Firmicutes bacterium]|nr:translation initiation factor IF-3 C-terminal domain-containing protein [Bacillota bacterium]
VNKAREFLKSGNKVKVTIRFRGREISYSKSSVTILENFANEVAEFGVVDKAAKMEGRSMVMFLTPKAQ